MIITPVESASLLAVRVHSDSFPSSFTLPLHVILSTCHAVLRIDMLIVGVLHTAIYLLWSSVLCGLSPQENNQVYV